MSQPCWNIHIKSNDMWRGEEACSTRDQKRDDEQTLVLLKSRNLRRGGHVPDRIPVRNVTTVGPKLGRDTTHLPIVPFLPSSGMRLRLKVVVSTLSLCADASILRFKAAV